MTDGIGEQRTSIPTSTQRSRSIEMNCRNSLCTVQSISTYMYVAYSAVRTSTAASVVSPPTISSTFTCAQPFIPELKPIVAYMWNVRFVWNEKLRASRIVFERYIVMPLNHLHSIIHCENLYFKGLLRDASICLWNLEYGVHNHPGSKLFEGGTTLCRTNTCKKSAPHWWIY